MTRVFTAYNTLLTITQSVGADAGRRVFDGPQPVPDSVKDYVIVGCDDAYSGNATAVLTPNGEAVWASLGAYARDETFTIPLAVVSWRGNPDYAAMRTSVEGFVSAMESALVPNSTLGATMAGPNGSLGATSWTLPMLARAEHVRISGGFALQAVLVVSCTTRLISTP